MIAGGEVYSLRVHRMDCMRMSHPRRGFTLVELLVVTGIIAMLIAILLPAIGTARQQAFSVKCLAQLRQLSTACLMYSADNGGWMPSCDTAGPLVPQDFVDSSENPTLIRTGAISSTHTWVGWVDGGPTAASLSNGTLWKYVHNATLYKCPSDLNDYRVRSYSLNNFLCTGQDQGAPLNSFKIYKITQVGNAAATLQFAEEPDPRGNTSSANALAGQWNQNGWVQNPIAFNEPSQWADIIAAWHRHGGNFTFVDGHAEYWRFADIRTVNYLKNDPNWPDPYYSTPNNPDLTRIQRAMVSWPAQRAR